MDLPDIFLSPESLRTAFENGLERQLQSPSLGTFILVLANALLDEQIFNRFRKRLQNIYEFNKQEYSGRPRQGKVPPVAPDDMMVFLKLIGIGFDNLSTTEYRQLEDWELQFNQLRSLRPKRMSASVITHLLQKFEDRAFHFNKPFLAREVFWKGKLEGKTIKLLYNKFPFATLHGLLVPEPEKNLPQFLIAEMHHFISSFCNQLGTTIPEIAIAYNSYGASASINHLHFQTFCNQRTLPVLGKQWQHNGGNKPYPTVCRIFQDSDDAWQYISHLHHKNTPYNLVYLPGKVVCLPRNFQGTFAMPEWTENFAWYELCGGVTTFNREDFLKLDNDTITHTLARLKPAW